MSHIIIALISVAAGAGVVFFLTEHWRKELLEQSHDLQSKQLQLQERLQVLDAQENRIDIKSKQFDADKRDFEKRVVTYEDLLRENSILKTDLQNLDITIRKQAFDVIIARRAREELDTKVNLFGTRYLADYAKWIGNSLNPNNFEICRRRLDDAIDHCQEMGLSISPSESDQMYADLRARHHKVVRVAAFREEQAAARAQLREDQQRQLEIEKEQQRLAREKKIVEEALANALAIAKNQFSEEVVRLQAQLAEAESRQRSMSQAQLTKSGHVYVISNIGSFGEGVFKVGMTRRLDPLDRVLELGDASVPFPFDVHMMIACEDAPALENALHRELHKSRVNKTNPRKEFFRSDISAIYKLVAEHHGHVEYMADAEALQYRQSLTISDNEEEYIEQVFASLEDESEPDADEE